MKKEVLQNISRDIIALGSPIFLLLVAMRLLLIPNYEIIFKLIVASVIFFIPFYLLKQDIYSGIGVITAFFLIQNYNDNLFTIFTSLTYILLLGCLIYSKKDKLKIFLGTVIGIAGIFIATFVLNIYQNL